MVDPKADLGRDVVSARNVLEVMRPQINAALCIGPALAVGIAVDASGLASSEDLAATDAVFNALRDDAVASIKDWAKDVDKVFDGDKLVTYVADVLNECFNGPVSPAVVGVVSVDPEAIGAVRTLHGALVSLVPSDFKALVLP